MNKKHTHDNDLDIILGPTEDWEDWKWKWETDEERELRRISNQRNENINKILEDGK